MGKPATEGVKTAGDELIDYSGATGPFFVTSKTAERPILLAKSGPASCQPNTVTALLKEAFEANANLPVYAAEWPEPALVDGKAPGPLPLSQWKTWTFGQALKEIQLCAKGYIALGHQQFDTVSILGFNSPFWVMGALGAIYGAGINNGMYPTDTSDQLLYKLQNSETSIILVDTVANMGKFEPLLDEAPLVKAIVLWKEKPSAAEIQRKDGTTVQLLTWDDLLEKGKEVDDAVLEERVNAQKPGSCCTLVFTSGTTGVPKAVMISHDNLNFQMFSLERSLPKELLEKRQLRMISYLPLSHIAGFFLDVCSSIAFSFLGKSHCTMYFARSYDLKTGSLVDRLTTVRPTIFFGVPRVWEKIAEKLKAKAPKGGLKKKIGAIAKSNMAVYTKNQQLKGSGKKPVLYGLSNKLLKKVHVKLGLDQAIYFVSAAAPMKKEMLEYWGSVGVSVKEVYGMSENTGVATTSSNAAHLWGSVGFPQPGTEFKVFKVNPNDPNDKEECPPASSIEDNREEVQGELCYRGRHIMLGYLANPALGQEHVDMIEKKNKSAIDNEGWLHSGDKGLITDEGMVKITGRYKELIIGAGGENIAPVPIEDYLKASCPAISNVMMIGNDRKYNVALITLLAEGATGEKPGGDNLDGAALTVSPGVKTISEAMKDSKFIQVITEAVEKTNSNGKVCFNNSFKIQKFTILPHDFSVETEELTPTLKLKRSVVEKMNIDIIDKMYETDGKYIPYE